MGSPVLAVFLKKGEKMKTAILLNSDEIGAVAEKDVICADGGYRYSEGKNVLAVVGDFDSVPALPEGVKVVRYPEHKDMTDGEIAVRYAVSEGYGELNIYGATGGRLDHVLGNLSLLGLAGSLGAKAKITAPGFTVYFTDKTLSFAAKKGQIVSVFAYGGDAVVEYQKGMSYPMDMLRLVSFNTRGISNIAVGNGVEIKVASGKILVFHFDAE